MRCRLHQDRQGARRAEVTARPEHSGPAEPTDPDRHISGSRGFLFPPFHTPLFSHLIPPSSTTAAISAFLCRCGMAFLTDPLLQTFRTALPSCSSSTTAASPAILCRCGIAFLTDPLLQTPWATFSFSPLSTTAAIPAFLCRCGMAFLTIPLLQTPWATFSFRPLSTTAAFSAILCRCGMAFPPIPCYRPSAKSSRLRKVSF